MKLRLEISSAYCATDTFEINGIDADVIEFGDMSDMGDGDSEDFYGCHDMQFIPKLLVNEDVLKKYSITPSEYRDIQGKLDELSFGNCGLCE